MIRSAVIGDRFRIITLLSHARDAAGFDKPDGGFSFPFDAAYAERLILVHMTPRHLCLVHDVESMPQGVLMAAAAQHPFGPVMMARETVWWIEPEYRGLAAVKMLDAYETWARGQGCAFVGMAGMGADPDVGRLYLRRGYAKAETHYLKAV